MRRVTDAKPDYSQGTTREGEALIQEGAIRLDTLVSPIGNPSQPPSRK